MRKGGGQGKRGREGEGEKGVRELRVERGERRGERDTEQERGGGEKGRVCIVQQNLAERHIGYARSKGMVDEADRR